MKGAVSSLCPTRTRPASCISPPARSSKSAASPPGCESRHNLKYWNCEEYLGIGPSAHSFIGGGRFFFPRDTESFIANCEPVSDGEGGGFEEYLMLRLRLCEGLIFSEVKERFGHGVPENIIEKCERFSRAGLTVCDGEHIALTRRGFLVSNAVIAELM